MKIGSHKQLNKALLTSGTIISQNKVLWNIHALNTLKPTDILSKNCMTSRSVYVTFILKLNQIFPVQTSAHTANTMLLWSVSAEHEVKSALVVQVTCVACLGHSPYFKTVTQATNNIVRYRYNKKRVSGTCCTKWSADSNPICDSEGIIVPTDLFLAN